MSMFSSLMLILVLIVCVFSFNQQPLDDHICKVTSSLLCVKEELMIIATTVKGIARTTNEIEKNITETKFREKLLGHVNRVMNYTHFNLPTTQFHSEFSRRNNIDKKYLSELFSEAHNAVLYYHNSINDLLSLEDLFGQTIDNEFKKIQHYLQHDVICRYRSILYVYSHEWKSIDEIERLQFSKIHLSPSFIHDVRSVVIARYLREWMDQINNVIVNLEMKFF